MSNTIFRNKNKMRPKKTESRSRQRFHQHRQRLIALGMPESEVEKLTRQEARTLLRHPKKVESQYSN